MKNANEIVVAAQRNAGGNPGRKFTTIAGSAVAGGATGEKDLSACCLRCARGWCWRILCECLYGNRDSQKRCQPGKHP